MFSLLVIFALGFQLPTATSSLFCLNCTLLLDAFSSDVINTTSCANRISSPVCVAELNIGYAPNYANVVFSGGSDDISSVLNGKNMIKHYMNIDLGSSAISRTLQLFCFNNDSCSEDMKKIYDKSKNLNHTALQTDLKNRLYNVTALPNKMTCANNEDQEIPCPIGCCELRSNGKNGFHHKCSTNPCSNGPHVIIEQQVIGETNAESTFTYTCNKPMCNNNRNAADVRDLLKNKGLLTPTGIEPDPTNSAVTILGQTSIVLQCMPIITMILFSKYI